MPDAIEREWKRHFELGLANRETIELARRHCLELKFVQNGGGSAAEQVTGLPINMRQVRCPVALGNMSMNLHSIATDFYRAHCIDCERRRPTGEVPNLATVVAAADAAAAAQQSEACSALQRARTGWRSRADRRQALAASSGDAMAAVLHDVDILDHDPGSPESTTDRDAARSRIAAVADRAPELFTSEVLAELLGLCTHVPGGDELLDPLRRLARGRPEFADEIVRCAVDRLRHGYSVWAGPCVAEHADRVESAWIDRDVCHALVVLAGAPAEEPLERHRANRSNDPTGLQAVASIAPETVKQVLRSMLPPPESPSPLVLPPGIASDTPVTTLERAAAANAIRALAGTAPKLAADLVGTLVLDLAVPPEDDYDDPASPAIQRTLAVLLVLDVGEVLEALSQAGHAGDREFAGRLMSVLSLAAEIVSADGLHREPGDPTPDAPRRVEVRAALVTAGLARAGGDWGDEARLDGAQLVEELAKDDPASLLPKLAALLGGALNLVGAQLRPRAVPLHVAQVPDPAVRKLEEWGRRNAISLAAQRLLSAVESVAALDAKAVCAAIVGLVSDERDTERGTGLVVRILPVLGRVASRHGDQTGVLRTVLPTLYSYLVGAEPGPRAAAIDAWTEVASSQPLPSTLLDLLPALTTDPMVVVAQAVTHAAARLDWTEEARARLLTHAFVLADGVDPTADADVIKDAIQAAARLARTMDTAVRAPIEQRLIGIADRLSGYDLREALTRDWLPQTSRSSLMARLRLRQAADPMVNDRWNRRDDEELCALLACGPGLAGLDERDLVGAAHALAPGAPLAALEFAEVAWRAGRLDTTRAITDRVFALTPDQPAYTRHRQLIELVAASTQADAEAAEREASMATTTRVRQAVSVLAACDSGEDVSRLATCASSTLEVRRLLTETSERAGGDDPAALLRARADILSKEGTALVGAGTVATDTGAYLRAFGAATEVLTHLMRAEAAALAADREQMGAHHEAATRRAQTVIEALTARFGHDDPLAGPLVRVLQGVTSMTAGQETSGVLTQVARLLVPLPVTRGPQRSRPMPTADDESTREASAGIAPSQVAVALVSIDGQLMTGPEVLHPNRVYNLSLEVRTGTWPYWADRLEAELLSTLTPADITIPEFAWRKVDHVGDGETYAQSGSLLLRFALGATQPAVPLRIRLAWRGQIDGEPAVEQVDVAGHREVRVRPYDAARDRATDFPVFDERLLTFYDTLARSGYDDAQFQAFCRLLTSICRVGLRMTWDKRFGRGSRVREKEFHDELHARLMADPELGGRVERGTPLGLGYLDVRHDGITAELKVARLAPVTPESAHKYVGQPAQYAAADGTRLSILTILDMSPKLLPPGTPENYLFSLRPQLHGLDDPAASSMVAVLIVNGNLPSPSSWSRRKLPTLPWPDEDVESIV